MRKLNENQVKEIIRLCAETSLERNEIAKKFNVDVGTIYAIISGRTWKKIGRPCAIKVKDKVANMPELTSRQIDIVVGSMLGDGCFPLKVNNCCFSKTQCFRRLEYLQWMYDELLPYSSSIGSGEVFGLINNKGVIVGKSEEIFKYHRLLTISHPIFSKLERVWYLRNSQNEYVKDKNNRRIKCIPNEIQLTPLSLSIWYLDDGSNVPANNAVLFSTDGFTRDEVRFLSNKLKETFDLKSKVYMKRNRPVIEVHSRSYLDFMNIVKPYVHFECFQYKIDTSKYKELRKYNRNEFIGVYYEGKTWRAVMIVDWKRRYLGSFATKQEAIDARRQAEQERIKNGNVPRQFMQYIV